MTGIVFAQQTGMLRFVNFFLIMILVAPAVFAQNTQDEQLAMQYYQEGEYEKALPLLSKAFYKDPVSTNHFYEYYLNTLLALKKYDEAEKELKRLIRKNDYIPDFLIDLGYVYEQQGEQKKATDQYEQAINSLTSDGGRAQQLANAFYKRGKTAYAIKAYEKGRQLSKNNSAYAYQLARLYQAQGQYDKMMQEYLGMAEQNPEALEIVKNNLQDLVMEKDKFDKLRMPVLERIQKDPSNHQYTDLLSWMFVQQKDFNAAFIQLRAIDKKLKEQGERLLPLAEIAVSNGEYAVAEKIYNYVLDQGEEGPFYSTAVNGLLNIKYHRVTVIHEYTQQDVLDLEKALTEFVESYRGRISSSGDAALKLAEIQAIYLDKPRQAIERLEQITSNPKADPYLKARAKLAAADYYIMAGDVWEAALLYGQVEKDFKDHPLGHEAKFRNARLSFFRSEFEWAKAQLNVLKGSTSELIANDALQLELTINDNLNLDTTSMPLSIYAEADFNYFKGKYDQAFKLLDLLMKSYPKHTLTDEAWIMKARMYYRQKNVDSALTYLTKIYTDYGHDILSDDALFMAANIYESNKRDKQKAMELYEKLIFDHPDSIYSVEARKRYRQLRGDKIN